MVRKGNQHKNGLDCKTANCRQIFSDPIDASLSEEKQKFKLHSPNTVDGDLSVGGNLCRSSSCEERVKEANYMGSGKRNKQRLGNPRLAEMDDIISNGRNTDENDILHRNNSPGLFMSEGLSMETISGHIRSSAVLSGQRLRLMALDLWNVASGWLEQQKPRFSTYKTRLCNVYDYVLVRTKDIYPIIWTWILQIGQLLLFLFVIWVDCNIRGINSLLHLGTSSFFTVVWCSILSIIAMVGFTKALIVVVFSALVALFVGFALGILILAILSTISLWLYGSFWITSLIVFIGGSTFALSHERVALLVTTVYSMYCAKSYVGLLGLLLGLNLSFLSSDILTYIIKNKIEHESHHFQEQDRQTPSEPSSSSFVDDASASRRSGVPSTSGCEEELTSEGEVVRLLNCSDHYSALGFVRFENIDVSLLKREYRKKAMLVHPDKNMGNEKAAEAFKKLQNAYEVLLDSLKRKTYDDELRREELLNYFRRFQSASQKKGKHNIVNFGSSHFDPEDEGSHGESRRIACKKCGDFHKWTRTERSKSRARWCQDCNDFHPAKDGDGWLEQSLHPFLFGLLQKADPPCAYVCADSRIYDATEWFICQGMRCPANTHKPSFHVNTSLSSKHSSSAGKGASSSHRGGGGGGGMPNSTNIDEPMTEEEFFEWLQNALQSGGFEASGGNESPSAKSASSSKGSGSVKKKKKGKKQW